jgi:hypothetical protein
MCTKVRMQHHVLDLSELHGMKLNLIPVSNLEGFKQRRRIKGRCLLAMLFLIRNQVNSLVARYLRYFGNLLSF